MRARSIVNRFINEHHTCKNNNVSNTTNDTGSVIYPNQSIKKKTTQREKNRPKDLIKKIINNRDQLKIGFVNIQSALNKALMIKDYIFEHNFDIFYIAESWFNK